VQHPVAGVLSYDVFRFPLRPLRPFAPFASTLLMPTARLASTQT
jgi:hypothetical protein